MERYIKYKRFEYSIISLDKLQETFDDLIGQGWEILHYEEERTITSNNLNVVVIIAGKKQDTVLGRVL